MNDSLWLPLRRSDITICSRHSLSRVRRDYFKSLAIAALTLSNTATFFSELHCMLLALHSPPNLHKRAVHD